MRVLALACLASAACGGGKASPDGAGSAADTGLGGTVAVDGGTVACLANTMVLAGDLDGQRIDAQATGPTVAIQHVNGADIFDVLAPFNDWQVHVEWNTQFTAGYPPGVGWGVIKLPFESSAHGGESFCVTDGRLTEVDGFRWLLPSRRMTRGRYAHRCDYRWATPMVRFA